MLLILLFGLSMRGVKSKSKSKIKIKIKVLEGLIPLAMGRDAARLANVAPSMRGSPKGLIAMVAKF